VSERGEPQELAVLAGLVERVTYHNAENGFCVLRAKARGHRDLVTVVGHAAIISAGEWITDRTHGQQFKARFMRTSAPSSIEGIGKYLGSGMIRGIGPVYAKKMVKAFGEQVFDVIEAEPDCQFSLMMRLGVMNPDRGVPCSWLMRLVFLNYPNIRLNRAPLWARRSLS